MLVKSHIAGLLLAYLIGIAVGIVAADISEMFKREKEVFKLINKPVMKGRDEDD